MHGMKVTAAVFMIDDERYEFRLDVCLKLDACFNHPDGIAKGYSGRTCDDASAESVESRGHRWKVLIQKGLGRFISICLGT